MCPSRKIPASVGEDGLTLVGTLKLETTSCHENHLPLDKFNQQAQKTAQDLPTPTPALQTSLALCPSGVQFRSVSPVAVALY